jgi:parvulin-like peptidyl-prolyl isomerase
VPTAEEVAADVNRQKVESRLSAEEFAKEMETAGIDEATFRDAAKRGMAINKLVEKITGRIESPKDKEIAEFFTSNPDVFVKKRGVRLAAIVVDPANTGDGDTTTNEAEATVRVKEILTKVAQSGSDFATIARESSEDPSKFQGGDLGFFSEQDLRANYPQLADGFMNPSFAPGKITNPVPIAGKFYIFKLQERIEKEETQTIESPGVRQQIIDLLVNNRKQLLAASYQAIAMNEAKIENFLAKKVVDNPNELSGARPAGAKTPAVANANTEANLNANASSNANSAAPTGTGALSVPKPAANTSANAANASNSK